MKHSAPAPFIRGQLWKFKYLIFSVAAALIFTCSPSIFVRDNVQLPPAYQLKAEQPFADTSGLKVPVDEGERSHGAKLTPRLTGSVLLHLAHTFSLHPYLPASVFGLVFLFCGIQVGYLASGDRHLALLTGLLFAGLHATSTSFAITASIKPFDGVALGLLGLAMISIRHIWPLAIASFLACWSDERAILALAFVGVFAILLPRLDRRDTILCCITLASAILAYGLSRVLVAHVLDWGSPDMGMIGSNLKAVALFLPLAIWTCFEGGWIAVILAVALLYSRQQYVLLCLLSGSVLTAIASSLVVIDISRAGSFAFPLIPAAIAALVANTHERELRLIVGAGAITTLLGPNFDVYLEIGFKLVQPFLMQYWYINI